MKANRVIAILLVLVLLATATTVAAKPKPAPKVSPYCIKCVTCQCSDAQTFTRCNGGYSCDIAPPSCSSGSPFVFCRKIAGPWCNCI